MHMDSVKRKPFCVGQGRVLDLETALGRDALTTVSEISPAVDEGKSGAITSVVTRAIVDAVWRGTTAPGAPSSGVVIRRRVALGLPCGGRGG